MSVGEKLLIAPLLEGGLFDMRTVGVTAEAVAIGPAELLLWSVIVPEDRWSVSEVWLGSPLTSTEAEAGEGVEDCCCCCS